MSKCQQSRFSSVVDVVVMGKFFQTNLLQYVYSHVGRVLRRRGPIAFFGEGLREDFGRTLGDGKISAPLSRLDWVRIFPPADVGVLSPRCTSTKRASRGSARALFNGVLGFGDTGFSRASSGSAFASTPESEMCCRVSWVARASSRAADSSCSSFERAASAACRRFASASRSSASALARFPALSACSRTSSSRESSCGTFCAPSASAARASVAQLFVELDVCT